MSKNQGITIGKVRSALYGSAKVLGDVNAVARGQIAERVGRRAAGWATSQIISAIFRAFRR